MGEWVQVYDVIPFLNLSEISFQLIHHKSNWSNFILLYLPQTWKWSFLFSIRLFSKTNNFEVQQTKWLIKHFTIFFVVRITLVVRIHILGVTGSKPQGSFKADSVFHPSKID